MPKHIHAWSCQVLWGGRWQEGACATTGEEVELINSHFSRLGTTTKHMLPKRREELLTEHALSWNKRKIVALPSSLSKRYVKVKHQWQKARTEMIECSGGIDINEIYRKMTGWIDDVVQVAKEQELSNKPVAMTFQEKYFLAKSLTLGNATPSVVQVLCDVVSLLYPKAFNNLKKKGIDVRGQNDLLAKCSPDDDETARSKGQETLKAKCLSNLQRLMMFKHYSIAQVSYYMGKCSGGTVIISSHYRPTHVRFSDQFLINSPTNHVFYYRISVLSTSFPN